MSAADFEWIKTAASALGVAAVLSYMLRYFMNKLDAKDAEAKAAALAKDTQVASMIEKQAARDLICTQAQERMAATLERISGALDRVERRMDSDHFSGPHKKADLMGGV